MLRGNEDERRVYELCEAFGHEPRKTSGLDDSARHIDLTVVIEGKRVGVDVKGARRVNRQDSNFSYWYTWLELRNRNGLRGSLFGEAEYLVIASPRGWLWCDRAEVCAECVLRYIEHSGVKDANKAWLSKQRGHSVIILVPYTYLYKVARAIWQDAQLEARCYAAYKQESNARKLDT